MFLSGKSFLHSFGTLSNKMNIEVGQEALASGSEHHEMRPFSGAEASGSFISMTSTASCTIGYTRSAKIYLFGLILINCLPLMAGAAFTSIFIEDHNVYGAIGSFFTAVLSFGTLSLFVLHLMKKVDKFHDEATLNGLKILGMLVSVFSGIGLGVFTILTFLKKQAFELKEENFFSAAVFSGLSLATSLELYIVAQWYQNALERNKVLITYQMPGVSGRS